MGAAAKCRRSGDGGFDVQAGGDTALIGGAIKENIKRGMSTLEKTMYDRWSELALVPAVPFAMAELLPPQTWQAISILLGAAR